MLVQPPKPITTATRISIAGSIKSASGAIDFGRYKLSELSEDTGGVTTAIFSFEDEVRNGYSNPEEESKIVLQILSLLFNARIERNGFSVNGMDLPPRNSSPAYKSKNGVEVSDYQAIADEICCLGEDVAKQFVRSCNAYNLAIISEENDTTLSFLLLVVSIESLSTLECAVSKDQIGLAKSAERYCEFIIKYSSLVDQSYPVEVERVKKDLKTIYYSHRSAFVHAGKDVSIAASVADKHGLESLSHYVDGELIRTPGLSWFFGICRAAIVGFIRSGNGRKEAADTELFSKIAKSRSVLTMPVARNTADS